MKKIINAIAILALPCIALVSGYALDTNNKATTPNKDQEIISANINDELVFANKKATKIEQDTAEIKENTITKLFPNPASSSIKLEYYLIEKATVKIDVYDMSGNHVKNYVNDLVRNAGENAEELDLGSLSIGKYEVRLLVGDSYKTKSFVIMR
jgi:hypothetical protein